MLTSLLSRFALPLVIFLAGSISGIFLQEKFFYHEPHVECPKAPDCKCPAPTVQMQPFDVQKMKDIKGFTYAPQYSGNISIAGTDTTRLREIIERSVRESLKNVSPNKKTKK